MTTSLLSSLTFNHLGLAVKDDKAALTMLGAMGYAAGERIHDPIQNVHVRLCFAERFPTVEIVQPGDGPGKSPVDGVISKYNQMIYHTCYETRDLDETLAEYRRLGLQVLTLSQRQPAVLFGGRHVSFHMIQGVGIVELLELS